MRLVLVGGDSLLIECGSRALARGNEIIAVITSDRAVGEWADAAGIRCLDLGADPAVRLTNQPFDVLLSIANLVLLPESLIRLPAVAAVNLHDGPLPRYAGLNGPNWALLAGEAEHGIAWHRMTHEANPGHIVVDRRFPIEPGDTGLTLNIKCFEAAIESFDELLDALGQPVMGRAHQLERSTYHRSWDRPEGIGVLRWDRPAGEIEALARALDFGRFRNPLCRPKLLTRAGALEVGRVEIVPGTVTSPGTVIAVEEGLVTVAAGDGAIQLADFRGADGASVSPGGLAAFGIEIGAMLPVLTKDECAELDRDFVSIAKAEGQWSRTLPGFEPAMLPDLDRRPPGPVARYAHPFPVRLCELANRSQGTSASEHPALDEVVLSAVGLFISALTGASSCDVGLASPPEYRRGWLGTLVHPWRPVRLDLSTGSHTGSVLNGLATQFARTAARAPFAADLWSRIPQLRDAPRSCPIVLVPSTGGPVAESPGAQLTIGIAPNHQLEWRSDRLTHAELAQLADRFELFAERLVDGLDLPIEAHHALTPSEARLVAGPWRGQEWSDPVSGTIEAAFAARAAAQPDAPALVCRGEVLSYRELERRATQLANRLRTLGATPGMPIGVAVERSNDLLVAVLGVLQAGAAYLPLDPSYPRERLAFMIADSTTPIVITEVRYLDLVPPGIIAICLDRDRAELDREATESTPSAAKPDDLAYLIYTSGSTGQPKGVMVEHRNVLNLFAAMDRKLGADRPGVWLALTSLSFDISVLELLWTLTRGFKVVIYVDENRGGATANLANASQAIDFSLFYFSAAGDAEKLGQPDKYRMLLEGARWADEYGFAAVWTPERHFHAFGGLYPNPSVTGAAVAAITKRVAIRAGSCVLPLHHPVRVAEEWAVVDNLSNGRVGISFAAGWQPDDFLLRPDAYQDAKSAMFRDLEVVRRLWRGEALTFPGPRGDVTIRCLPRPVQAELPIWVTTAGNIETFEAAGRVGARVLTHLLGQTVAEVEAKGTAYRRAWRAAGHPGEGYVTLVLHTLVGEDTAAVKELVRGPMKEYLRTSISLIKNFAAAFPTFKRKDDALDFGALTSEEMDALLEYSFERYFESSGLLGDLQTCADMVDRLKGAGIDEIACLIDFGVPIDVTLRHLKHLDRLRRLNTIPARTRDFSVPALIAEHGVTHLQCTPSMASMFLSSDRIRPSLRKLEVLLVGGEALTPALAEGLGRVVPGRILNMYGPTETTIWSTMSEVRPGQPVTIGIPLLNTEIWILDRLGRPVPPGAVGEICIGGLGVARGYWHRPELTEERFVELPVAGARLVRLYRTGDLARFGPDGTIEFLGRLDGQVKIRGYRIELGEIESVLGLHPAVREAATVVSDFGPDDRRIVAYYTARADVSGDQLRSWLKERLPEQMVPAHLIAVAVMPRTPNQKIDRKALPDPIAAAVASPKAAAPAQSGAEHRVASVWKAVLRLPSVGAEDNFFDLGGHSLLAVKVHGRLEQELGRKLAITDLFRYPTVRSFARFLDSGADASQVKASQDRGAARRAALERRNAARSGAF